MHSDAERLGDDVLRLGRPLRGRMDDHLTVLAGNGQRCLGLEVEVLLPEAVKHAGEPVRRGGDRGGGIAPGDPPRRPEKPAEVDRPVDRKDRLGDLDVEINEPAGLVEGSLRFGGDHHHRLADVEHLAVGENRFVLKDRAKRPGPRQIGRRHQVDDTRHPPRCREPDAADPPTGNGARHEADHHLVGPPRQVVDVGGRAGDVAHGGVVRDRPPHTRHVGRGIRAGLAIRSAHPAATICS